MAKREGPIGVGIDMVCICELKKLTERSGTAFINHTFSEKERAEACNAADYWGYLAGRFAAKEAVFKAVAPLTPEKTFDFRLVETIKRADGSPCVRENEKLRAVLDAARVQGVLLSISTEGGFAVAMAIAVSA